VDELAYCTAKVMINELDEKIDTLASFNDVLSYLGAVHDWFIEQVVDRWGNSHEWGEESPRLGGFGVQLQNRWGGVVEVGVGDKVWFLHRHKPKPSRTFSDHPEEVGYFVFYLDGWHWTELDRTQLASHDACLSALRDWLDDNCFPDRLGP
jgi:hypothetical protein